MPRHREDRDDSPASRAPSTASTRSRKKASSRVYEDSGSETETEVPRRRRDDDRDRRDDGRERRDDGKDRRDDSRSERSGKKSFKERYLDQKKAERRRKKTNVEKEVEEDQAYQKEYDRESRRADENAAKIAKASLKEKALKAKN
jgi:hypothetical protein